MNTLKRYTFDYPTHIRQIVMVGLGGTGSQLARSVARMVFDMRERRLQIPRLVLVDPDKVERKNVGRQMFTVADIGKYKATLLASRFNKALGLDILALPRRFNPKMLKHQQRETLLIGCVDNPEARRAMAETKSLWLDCGNHYDTGQVILGNNENLEAVRHAFSDKGQRSEAGIIITLPAPHVVFPSLLEPDKPASPTPELSCADLVARGDQHLFINEYVALAASQYVYRLLHRQPIHSHMSYVSADTGTIKPVLITSEIAS